MNKVKSAFSAYLRFPLILKILIGLAIGTVLGIFVPNVTVFSTLGELFTGALKAIAPILVFVLIISSLSSAGKGLGTRFTRIIVLYMLSTFLAAAIAVVASFVFPVTVPLGEISDKTPPGDLGAVLTGLLLKMVENPVSALIDGNYLSVLTWSIGIGIAIRKVASENTKSLLSDISSAVSSVVGGIIQLAPFGILGLVYASVKDYGLDIFLNYGKLLLVLVGCMLVVFLVIDPLLVFLCLKRNPYPLVWRCVKESGISAFFTRSSAANIPVNMRLCRRLGLDKEYYSVAVPLGATINMDGAAITITILSLSAAFTCGREVNFFVAILLSFVATLGACGASGVAGGSLLLIPMACSLLGVDGDIAMQMVAVGFLIGVIQDSLETAINSAGDVIFASTAEYMEWKKQGKPFTPGAIVCTDKEEPISVRQPSFAEDEDNEEI